MTTPNTAVPIERGEQGSVTFEIRVTMFARWVPHFLAMLKHMQYLGGVGASRRISFMSDGDGDFRPKFEWSPALNHNAEPREDDNGSRFYDAG